MGSNVITKPIDGNKLEIIIRRKGTTLRDFSRDIGRHPDYISDCKRRGVMAISAIKAIEFVKGVKYEEYALETENKTIPIEYVNGKYYSESFLKRKIKEVCYSQRDLGEKIGRSDSYISNWLGGKNTLNWGEIVGIAKVLNLDENRIPSCVPKIDESVEPQETPTVDVSETTEESNTELINAILQLNTTLNTISKTVMFLAEQQEKQRKVLSYMANHIRLSDRKEEKENDN